MNPKQIRKIRSKARDILVAWIKELIKKEDHSKVTRKNLTKIIESQSYYWSGRTIKLQPWSYKWIVKKLKKNPHWTLKDIQQNLEPSEREKRKIRMDKEGPIVI